MVKSANTNSKQKDIDIKKLKGRLERIAGGGSRSRDHSEGSPQSRQSRMNRGLDHIPERDPMLEQTGVGGINNYDAFSQPIGSKTR